MSMPEKRSSRPEQLPLRRDPPAPLRAGNTFLRFLAARVIAKIDGYPVADVIAERWPSDLVLRATVAPAMTSVAGWAAELAQTLVYDALTALGPKSAGAALLREGLVLSFDGAGAISAPGFVASAANAGFVAEGQPIPVRQLAGPPAQLLPHKIASIAVLTREMVESSNAEQLIGDALVGSAGPALDAVLFDSTAANATRPAGLRTGIAALTPSNNATSFEAVHEDVVALVNAVAPVAGNAPVVIIGSLGRAAVSGIRLGDTDRIIFMSSTGVGNDLIAVAPGALVAALSPEPMIESSKSATLVMDTAPGAAGTMGPERSVFQTDSLALKLRWPVTWALRDARGVAWLTPAWK